MRLCAEGAFFQGPARCRRLEACPELSSVPEDTKERIISSFQVHNYAAARSILRQWHQQQRAEEARSRSRQDAADAGSGKFISGWDSPERDSPQGAYFESHR